MDQTHNSDDKMAADVFEMILCQIQHSNLNYQIQISPFSAMISLKKSFAKYKKGTSVNKASSFDVYLGSERHKKLLYNNALESELNGMKIKYENLSSKYKAANAIIKDLENKLESSERSVEQLNESLGSKNSVIDDYEHDIDVWKRDLHEIHSAHLSLQQKVETLQTLTTFILEEPSSTDLDFNSNYSSGAFEGTISCTIFECKLEDCAPEYYCGRKHVISVKSTLI